MDTVVRAMRVAGAKAEAEPRATASTRAKKDFMIYRLRSISRRRRASVHRRGLRR